MGRQPKTAIVAARRQKVAQLLLRGLTQREIERALAAQKIFNPDTRKPWSLGTINSDVQLMEEEWREQAIRSLADRKARVAAELEYLRRTAWAEGDLELVRKLLKDERDMFGLDEPIEVSLRASGSVDVNHSVAQPAGDPIVDDMSEEELDYFIANMLTKVEIAPPDQNVIEGELVREAHEESVLENQK